MVPEKPCPDKLVVQIIEFSLYLLNLTVNTCGFTFGFNPKWNQEFFIQMAIRCLHTALSNNIEQEHDRVVK